MAFLQRSSSFSELLSLGFGLELSEPTTEESANKTNKTNEEASLKKFTEQDNEKKLVFSYENLTYFPLPNLLDQYGISEVEILDLSHNQLSNVEFLVHFPNLTTLIMDHNLLTSDTKFPTSLKTITTFWVNYNHIDKLHPFIQRVNKAFPNLKYFSLMGNIGCPSYLTGGTYYQYLRYRLFVISQLQNLECLDDLHVTTDQKEEAYRMFSRSYLQTLISLPIPQYLNQVQQRFKSYIREKSSNIVHSSTSTATSFRRGSEDSARGSSSSSSNGSGSSSSGTNSKRADLII